uniref:Uncharacterized protein n=1 Tax=Myotis myotis TaxID=51298 RepID=A0A7J7RVE1_MYOMY|nr:hypothetical protein mMyoMyo1_010169 [Myotis myotis]
MSQGGGTCAGKSLTGRQPITGHAGGLSGFVSELSAPSGQGFQRGLCVHGTWRRDRHAVLMKGSLFTSHRSVRCSRCLCSQGRPLRGHAVNMDWFLHPWRSVTESVSEPLRWLDILEPAKSRLMKSVLFCLKLREVGWQL